MPRSCLHACLVAAGLLVALISSESAAEDAPAVTLPKGVRPFREPITLRYGGFESFTYTFRSDIETPGRRQIAEGWVMAGTVRPQGDGRSWAYTLSNIGRDGVLRERGRLQVVTDTWGVVRQAGVVEDRWAPTAGRPKFGADAYFDAGKLRFPLCCCPSGPVRMGDVLPLPRQVETMPVPTPEDGIMPPLPPEITGASYAMRSVVAGLLEEGGRRYLAIRHAGEATSSGPDGTVAVQTEGYSLLDTRTCLPRRSLWRISIVPAAGGAAPMSLLHSNAAR